METRKRRVGWTSWVAMLALASVAVADDETQAEPEVARFTLTEAVDVALQVNPEVLQAREKTEEFGQLVREAKSDVYPEITANLSWIQNRDPGLSNSPFFSRLTEAEGEEGGGVNLDVQAVENRIARDVVLACYDFLLAQHSLEVLRTELESRQRQLDQVQVRFDLEDATKLDVLRARVTLANLQPEILAADNNLQIALASVNNTIGRGPSEPIEILEKLAVADPVPVVLRPEALMELAGQYRPELQRYAVDRAVLEARVGVTKADLKPQINATAGFGLNTFASSNVTNLALHTWNVGVNFDWTLFDGHRTSSRVAALRSQKTQNEHDEHAFRNRLSVELKRANGTWLRALEASDVTTLAVEQAREAQRVAEESLTWGAATSLDVFQSTLSLRQAELNRTTAAHNALVALAEMKYLVGFRADAPHSVISAPSSVADVRRESEPAPEGSQP